MIKIGIKVDPKIMAELLAQPGVKENVALMKPETLAFFKETLVSEGIYARFALEKQKTEVKQLFKSAFSGVK